MPSNIEKLLSQIPEEKINHKDIYKKYPWILKENLDCIISPDSDGFLCGLLMNNLLNWKIKGFYDGKVILKEKNCNIKDCVFLDIEIFSKEIKSIGNHCVIPHMKIYEELGNDSLKNCISPGLLRGFDGSKFFRLKYPLGTIHLLLSILFPKIKINLPDKSISSLLFPDGLFNVLFSYPENVLTWFDYLDFENLEHPMNKFIYPSNLTNNNFSLAEIMKVMRDYFIKRDEFGEGIIGRGDHLKLTDKLGKLLEHISFENRYYNIRDDVKDKIEGFIKMNATNCNFKYNAEDWSWKNFECTFFEKKIIGGEGNKYNQSLIREVFLKNLISGAQTAGNRFEYSVSKDQDIFSSI